MMKTVLAFVFALALASCALPNTAVRSGSVRPTISVRGAPAAAILYVDRLSVGPAAQFDGINQVLNIEEGAHTIEIRVGERTIHSERIVISTGESKVVVVSAGGTQ